MTKKEMIFYYDNVWFQHILGSEKGRHLKGSLSYYAVWQLELFCERAREKGEIPYAQHWCYCIEEKNSDDCQPTVQLSERKSKRKSVVWKEAGENESEGMLCYTLNPILANTAPLSDHVTVQITPMPRTYSLLPPLNFFPTYGERLEVSMLFPGVQALSFISPSKAPQGTQFGPGATFKTGQCLLSGYPVGGFKAKGQPGGCL